MLKVQVKSTTIQEEKHLYNPVCRRLDFSEIQMTQSQSQEPQAKDQTTTSILPYDLHNTPNTHKDSQNIHKNQNIHHSSNENTPTFNNHNQSDNLQDALRCFSSIASVSASGSFKKELLKILDSSPQPLKMQLLQLFDNYIELSQNQCTPELCQQQCKNVLFENLNVAFHDEYQELSTISEKNESISSNNDQNDTIENVNKDLVNHQLNRQNCKLNQKAEEILQKSPNVQRKHSSMKQVLSPMEQQKSPFKKVLSPMEQKKQSPLKGVLSPIRQRQSPMKQNLNITIQQPELKDQFNESKQLILKNNRMIIFLIFAVITAFLVSIMINIDLYNKMSRMSNFYML
jgi:hypothetical protein